MSDDIEIDEEEAEEDIAFWSERQKELVTAQVDYNLGTLRDLASSNTIDLKPHFQRRFRWDDKKESRLIESLLLNVPIPPIYLNEDRYGRYSVIDGKQRISAVFDFLSGKFPLKGLIIFSDLNELTFSGLPPTIQTILRTRPTMRAVIVLRQSDAAIKYEVFQRLNTGGVPLNPQEIRNNIFYGPLNEKINELGESPTFHRALRIVNKNKSKIYQEMRDSELVLRFMAFFESWDTFSGGVRIHMDTFMADNQTLRPRNIARYEVKFRQALENVMSVFGEESFKRWQPDKGSWRNQVLASLYDAQMLGLQEFETVDLIANKARIIRKFKSMFNDEKFLSSIDAATNTPSYLKFRVAHLRDAVRRIV